MNIDDTSLLNDISFVLFAGTGFAGTIGGTGTVFGTNDLQDITVFGVDNLTFESSFNRGGDFIRFPQPASSYEISRLGSSVLLNDALSSYIIPVGSVGSSLAFSDGVRQLRFDSTENAVKLGSQTVTTTPQPVTSPASGDSQSTGVDDSAAAVLFLADNDAAALGGNYEVFGTSGTQEISYLFGDVVLDSSFNRGGDFLYMPDPAESYSIYRLGSSVVLISDDGTVTIPVGSTGMTIVFADTQLELAFNIELGQVELGSQAITVTSPEDAVQVGASSGGGGGGGGGGTGGGDETLSIDDGNFSQVAQINLDAGTSYVLTDDISQVTNVVISGMTDDDRIVVSGISGSQFNFSTTAKDPDGIANDLYISYNNGTDVTLITVLDVADPNALVFTEAMAEAAVGWDLISFG